MKLNLEQIRGITVGAAKVEERPDGIHFYKCTAKQIKAWYDYSQVLGERSETATGIRLDLHTDSDFFRFEVAEKAKYEIYIDGVLCYAFTPDDFDDPEKTVELEKGEHRITLIMPSHAKSIIKKVELSDGAVFSRHKFDMKIAFFGDSITQGWDSKRDSLSFAYTLSRFYNAESIIQGVGGAVFRPETFDPELDFDPDMVFVAYGTNDWHHFGSLEELRANAKGYLDLVTDRYKGKKIFGISPIWRADTDRGGAMGSFADCCELVKSEITAHGIVLIDGDKLTPHLTDFYSDGYLHPNESGFAFYSSNLISAVQKHI